MLPLQRSHLQIQSQPKDQDLNISVQKGHNSAHDSGIHWVRNNLEKNFIKIRYLKRLLFFRQSRRPLAWMACPKKGTSTFFDTKIWSKSIERISISKSNFLHRLYHLSSDKDITTVSIFLYFLYDFNSCESTFLFIKTHMSGLPDFYNLEIFTRYMFL